MSIIQVGNVLCSIDIFKEMFCCNYRACRGVCCVEGDAGAPITLEEVADIEGILPLIEGELAPEARRVIEEQGIAYVDKQGDLVTSIVNGKDCVFTAYDDKGNCLCAIERAQREGRHEVAKPISCALYPIRVKRFSIGRQAAERACSNQTDAARELRLDEQGEVLYGLNYHRWAICREAVEKGHRLSMPVYKFLREPLTRMFGADWYAELEIAAKEIASAKDF